jgi:hypothetical protein
MKVMNLLETKPYSLRINAISDSSSNIDLGLMIPSSNSIFYIEDSATIKYS